MSRFGGNTRLSARGCAWLNRLAMTAAIAALSLSLPTMAQVEWTTSLSTAEVDLPLTNQRAASASDGATYTVALANDGENVRIRLMRISSSGTLQWVRWGAGGYSTTTSVRALPLLVHPDNSATIAYQDRTTGQMCVENFVAAGDSRFRQCFANSNVAFAATLASDGDIYLGFGYQRNVRKISASGALRWSRVEPIYRSSPLYGAGVDASGNYFEVQAGYLRSWSGTDGSLLNDVVVTGLNVQSYLASGKEVLSRANRDIAVIRSVATPSNAVLANVARFDVTGTLSWNKEITFAGFSNNASVSLVAGDNDTVYVVRQPNAEGDSQVAKLSATGVVLWQRHYANVRRVVESGNGLMAIRSDVNVAANSNDSFIFSIAAGDGLLGSPTIYTRADSVPPAEWFALTGGVLAAFASGTYAPSAMLQATSVFIGTTANSRWVVVATARPTTFIDQSDCLMPKLALSSPSIGWARTTAFSNNGPADWTRVAPATGAVIARTASAALGCGAPIASDGGRVVTSANAFERIKKLDSAGATVWATTSAVNPQQYSAQPITSVAANDEITYLAGSVLGRASASGAILFERETARSSARYLGVDTANNAWVVAQNASNQTVVSKTSAAGVEQWAALVDAPSCTDALLSARLVASNDMLVAMQSCGEGRLFKVSASGQVTWQRVVGGSALRPNVELRALNVDSAGNVYAGGCARGNNAPYTTDVSLVASWTAAGTERWLVQTDLIGNASECVSSIAVDSSDQIFAAVSSSDTSRAPLLWSFTAGGVERWRHSGVMASPLSASAELFADSTGKLFALGESPPNAYGPREVTLRRINVSTLASALKLKFLEVPTTLIGYRDTFPVRIGLRTAANATANATAATTVSMALQAGSGNLDGSLSCTIAIGASECTILDTRYDVIESGVTLAAGADGFATVTSPAIGFKTADTITSISALSAAPYAAFSVVRVRAATVGPQPIANQGIGGNLSGPYAAAYLGIDNCIASAPAGTLVANDCDLLVRSAAMPLTAQFSSYATNYNNSVATPLTLPVTRVATTLQISNDPANTYVAGDRVRFRVALLTPSGLNATQFVAASTVTVAGGSCGVLVATGNLANKFSGSYLTCEVTPAATGSVSTAISFAGSLDLLAAGPSNQTVTLNPGAVVRGSNGSFPTGVTVCSPSPGVTCGLVSGTSSEWQCSGPSGMSGQIFFVPPTNASGYYFPSSPIRFNNVVGVNNSTAYISYNYGGTACNLDVDGDGARMMATDGILILRRMFGLSGPALVDGATNVCAPRSAAGIAQAISLPAYDIDGDGRTDPATDGVLLLRAMLGFRGDALILGAVSATATRKTASDIQNFLTSSCAYPVN